MKGWCRWTAVCVLLVTAGAMRPSSGSAGTTAESRAVASTTVWSQRAQRFDERWRSGGQKRAEQEILADGRGAARTGLRRAVKELPGSDPRRMQAGLALYVLDLDRTLGRSVLVAACRPGARPNPFDWAFGLAASAYDYRPDRQLLSAVLELTPLSDGASADAMLSFVAKAATKHTRDLLLVLREKPAQVRRSVAIHLTPNLKGKPARQAYPEVARIAAQATDPLHLDAQRLLTDTDKAEKRQQSIKEQMQRREEQRVPLVPKGVALPASAVEALRASQPRSHIMATNGFDADVVSLVRERFGSAAGPQYCWGDFDGNGLRDVALLIRPNQGSEVRLTVLRQVATDTWATDELVSFGLNAGLQSGYSGFTVYITPRAPGDVAYQRDQGEAGHLDLKHDGVELNYFEKASVLYYWSGRGWATAQTGD